MPAKQDPYASPAQKAVSLYSLLLFTGKRYFLSELAAELDCSKQTVLRMMEQLERGMGISLETGKEGNRRWFRVKTPRTKPQVALDPDDISKLLLCRDLVRHLLPKPILKKLDEVVAKATVLLPNMEERSTALDCLGGIMVKGGIDYTPFEASIETLLAAIPQKEVCEVRYKSFNADASKIHYFAPMRLTAYREALYAEGWSVDPRGKPRQKHRMVLAVHRMEGAEPTRLTHDFEPWSSPEYFGFPECEPYRVKVALSESAARYVRERKWSDDQAFHEHEDGSAVLEFTAQSRSEVVSWVLSFGGEVELLEPLEVKSMIVKEIKRCSKIYKMPFKWPNSVD